jgi:hypothetical protein
MHLLGISNRLFQNKRFDSCCAFTSKVSSTTLNVCNILRLIQVTIMQYLFSLPLCWGEMVKDSVGNQILFNKDQQVITAVVVVVLNQI